MIRPLTWSAGALTFLIGANAAAQTVAPPDPPFALVEASERLTIGGVFNDADIVMKLVMGGLLLAGVAALAVWIVQASGLGRRSERGTAAAMAYLSALGAAGPLFGFFGSAYCLLMSCIGLSNVRPAPSISIVAPGLAEALLAAMLGLLAAAIATVGHRHLKAKLYGLGLAAEHTLGEPVQNLPRQARATA